MIRYIKHKIKKNKRYIYAVLYFSGITFIATKIYSKIFSNYPVVILMYHHVIDGNVRCIEKNACTHRYIDDFHDEIKLLSKWYEVISIDELMDCLDSEENIEKPKVVVTFDDGYRDNYNNAFPILKKYNVPASIYLVSGVIDTEKELWLERIETLLIHTSKVSIDNMDLLDAESVDISTLAKKKDINIRLSRILKRMEVESREAAVKSLEKYLLPDGYLQPSRKMLSWQEVREMMEHDVTIGAHTVSHPILSQISSADAESEISNSKTQIEKRIGQRVGHFALPNGGMKDFSPDVIRHIQNAGFSSNVTTLSGKVGKSTDRFKMPRISPNPPIWVFSGEILRAFIFGKYGDYE
jgi:peptidoglycan/xylan/chitin deacetylase (PgdA/CDA1 family)